MEERVAYAESEIHDSQGKREFFFSLIVFTANSFSCVAPAIDAGQTEQLRALLRRPPLVACHLLPGLWSFLIL